MAALKPPAPTDAPPAGDPMADLMAEAAAVEGGAAAAQQRAADRVQETQQQQQAAELATLAGELLEALRMLRLMAAPAFGWWQHFPAVWSDQQLDAIAQAGAAVMQRHGLTMGELFAQWGPYLALAGATLPPTLATVQAIRARREAPPAGNPHATPGERVQPAPTTAPPAA